MNNRVITPHIHGILNNDPVSANNLNEILDHCHERSKLKKGGVSTYDKTLRNSYTLYNAVLDMDDGEVIQALCDWNRSSNFSRNLPIDPAHTTIGYDKTIIYEKDGFFESHTDGKIDPSHIGTLLIFPPKSLSPYEGGELYISFQPYTAHETEWIFMYVRIGYEHRVSKVTSGIRTVFKYNVYDNTPVATVAMNDDDSDSDSEMIEDDYCIDDYY